MMLDRTEAQEDATEIQSKELQSKGTLIHLNSYLNEEKETLLLCFENIPLFLIY